MLLQKQINSFGKISIEVAAFKTLCEQSENKETEIAKIFKLRLNILENIINFVDKCSFERILDIQLIKDCCYDQKSKYILVDLTKILQDFNKLTQNISVPEKQWLNHVVESISQLLILYAKGTIRTNLNFCNQLEKYLPEIITFIYRIVKFKFKTLNSTIYSEIKKVVQNVYAQSQTLNKEILNIQFKEYIKLSASDQSHQLQNDIKRFQKIFSDQLEQELKFTPCEIFIYKQVNLLKQYLLQHYREAISNGYSFKKDPPLIEQIIFDYLKQRKFIEGLVNSEVFEQFQALIHLIDWNEEVEAELVFKIINYFNFIPIIIKNPIQQLKHLQKQNLVKTQKAQNWWKSLKETTNIIVITQIYQVLANIVYKEGKLQFQNYGSAERVVLTKLLRLLNDLQYGYQNIEVLIECEKISHQIEIKTYDHLNLLLNNIGQNNRNQYQINIVGKANNIQQIQLENKENSPQKFMDKFKLLMDIFNYPSKREKNAQKAILKTYIDQLQQKHDLSYQPSKLYFQVLSEDDKNSNIVTLCISGFLSSKEEKEKQWKDLIEQNSGTVIGLHWKSRDEKDFAPIFFDIFKLATQKKNNLDKLKTGVSIFQKNPYENANNEAIVVGEYLGLLIAECNLFGGRQLNLICHSLGSIVVQSCINKLDDLFKVYKKPFINKIIFMGGVADIRDLQSKQFASVYGDIYNFKSKKDQILRKVLGSTRIFDIPCGLNTVQSGYKQIKTLDFTENIDGHSDYWPKLKMVLMQTDIHQDISWAQHL